MPKAKRIPKNRILSVTIKRMLDDSPDTSCYGEYSNKQTSAYSIDRAHSEDCASVVPVNKEAQRMLENARGTVCEIQQTVFADDDEWQALEDAYNMLDDLAQDSQPCDCDERGDMQRNEYRFFNPSFNYVTKDGKLEEGLTDEEVRKYVRQDYERMESLNRGDWCFIGIRADAKIGVPCGKDSGGGQCYAVQEITSGGVFGYESDMSQTDFEEAESEQLADLKDHS